MKILLALDIVRDYLISSVRKEDLMILFNKMDDVGDKRFIEKGTKQYLFLNKYIRSETSIPIPNCYDVNPLGIPQMNEITKKRMKLMINEAIKQIKKDSNGLAGKENVQIASKGFEFFTHFYQLHLLKYNTVDIIISDDLLFHQLAKDQGISNQILTSEDYMERLTSDNSKVNSETYSIKKVKFKDIDVSQPFFDSFRDEYIGFNDWFNRNADAFAYVTMNEKRMITSFLRLKLECKEDDYRDVTPKFKEVRRLKISSYKVLLNGAKIGEAFFWIIFGEAVRLHVDELYVTVFDTYSNRRRLINRMERWGFKYYGKKNDEELVYVREFRKEPSDKYRLSYPFHSIGHVNFIVPLTAKYEDDLFGDYQYRTGIFNNPIRKVLLLRQCNIPKGSLILFYSKKKKMIINVGLSEYCRNDFNGCQELFVFTQKRTSFSFSQLKELWEIQSDKKINAIKFLNICHLSDLDSQFIINNMEKAKIFVDEEIVTIDQELYKSIINGTDYEKDFVVN